MILRFSWRGSDYQADTSAPIEIGIELRNGIDHQPNAYGAPLYEAAPVTSGDFIGSLEAGSPVNFFNVAINPHGNGTHTECVGHILKGPYSIRKCLQQSHCIAELITVTPEHDLQITRSQLESAVRHAAEAIVVRTLPNSKDKQSRKYTGTNPPFFTPDAMQWIVDRGYVHLLTDLPSVDPEIDGGALRAHRIFWNVDGQVRTSATITEMIYADEKVRDGLYLLDLHTVALDLDASPSRPVLYAMEKAE